LRNNAQRRCKAPANLLQLRFFVIHVLAGFGVKLFDQEFFGHGLLVFAGGVEVTRACCGFQLDFFACAFACHDALSDGVKSRARLLGLIGYA
jgi:hypothetical protein